MQANNFTFDPDQGGFADDNLLSIDQRGFKHLIQAEAETFLKPEQVLLNATVRTIGHSGDGVIVTLANGTRISADYAISTFSLGVLQNDDVVFEPVLPMWKQEAIQSMTMVRAGLSPITNGLELMSGRPRTRKYSCNSRRSSGLIHKCITSSSFYYWSDRTPVCSVCGQRTWAISCLARFGSRRLHPWLGNNLRYCRGEYLQSYSSLMHLSSIGRLLGAH